MKTVTNDKIDQIRNAKGEPATIIDLLKLALDTPPPNGWRPTIVHARARVDKSLEKATAESVEFEDQDYETARSAIAECPFALSRKALEILYSAFGLTGAA